MTPNLNQSHQIDHRGQWQFPPDPPKNRNIVHKGRDEGSTEWFVHGNTFSEYMDGVRCFSSSVCMFHCSAPFFFIFAFLMGLKGGDRNECSFCMHYSIG